MRLQPTQMFDSADDELSKMAAVETVAAAAAGYPGPGPSLDLSQGARAARLEKLADLPVFCVSAREAQKLERRNRSDGAPVVYKRWVLAACATHVRLVAGRAPEGVHVVLSAMHRAVLDVCQYRQ